MDERYGRQVLFSEIGRDGQQKLLNSRVLLVGCGALGSSHAEILARAGVGKLLIIDRDYVELTNLQRQTLFKESDAIERLPKAVAAKARIAEINSAVEVEPIVADLNRSNIEQFLDGCDLVLDGTDNFQARYLLNDACVKKNKTWIYGAAVSSYGTTMTVIPGETPCLRCVFDEMPDAGSSPTCDTAGVIMPIITSISAIQTTEALKILVGDHNSLHRSIIHIDIWRNEWRRVKLAAPEADCKTCGQRNYEFLDAESGEFSAVLCGRNAVQIASPKPAKLDLPAFAAKLSHMPGVKHNEYLVRFADAGYEITVFGDARAIIKGTDDISVARGIYSRFVGS